MKFKLLWQHVYDEDEARGYGIDTVVIKDAACLQYHIPEGTEFTMNTDHGDVLRVIGKDDRLLMTRTLGGPVRSEYYNLQPA